MFADEADRPVVSVHFPKASGTSLRLELLAAFGEANTLLSYDCDPLDPANSLWMARDWFLRNRPRSIHPYKVVHGHLPIIQFDLLPAAFRMVILREPVDNLISIYYFWRKMFGFPMKSHGLYDFVRREQLSLLEVAELPGMRWLMSRSYFGGYDMRRFDAIGSYDRREEFFAAVSAAIGRQLSAERRENVAPISEERGNVMNDTRLIARLRDLLHDDMRFYEMHTSTSRRSWLSRPFFMSGGRATVRRLVRGAGARTVSQPASEAIRQPLTTRD